jgi:hypothetical protein
MNQVFSSNSRQPAVTAAASATKSVSVLKKFSIILLLLVSSAGLHAQDIVLLDSFLEEMKASQDTALSNNAIHLESLLTGLQSTVYVGSSIKAGDETPPVCANVRAGSVSMLTQTNQLFNEVELIVIKLRTPQDLNFKLDPSKLTSFVKLKYVVFLCEFECSLEETQNLFHPKNGISFFHKVSIAS